MALENYRPIQFPEKTEIDNTDVVLIDSQTNGTNKYQLSRLTAQAQAAAQALVDAETAAREQDVDDLKEDLTYTESFVTEDTTAIVSEEKLTLYHGLFDINVYNPSTGAVNSYPYRISARKAIVLPFQAIITIPDGFRAYFYTFQNDTWNVSGWKTESYSVQKNIPFCLQISRTVEDTTETASVDEFLSGFTIATPLGDKISSIGSSAYNSDFVLTKYEDGGYSYNATTNTLDKVTAIGRVRYPATPCPEGIIITPLKTGVRFLCFVTDGNGEYSATYTKDTGSMSTLQRRSWAMPLYLTGYNKCTLYPIIIADGITSENASEYICIEFYNTKNTDYNKAGKHVNVYKFGGNGNDWCFVRTPANYDPARATPYPFVICNHGNGWTMNGSLQYANWTKRTMYVPTTDPDYIANPTQYNGTDDETLWYSNPTIEALLTAGYVVCGCENYGDMLYGNNNCRNACVDFFYHMVKTYNVEDRCYMIGASNGAMTSLNAAYILQGKVKAMILQYPLTCLVNQYEYNASQQEGIRTSYGITDSDITLEALAKAVATHDPLTTDVVNGIKVGTVPPIKMWYSTEDTVTRSNYNAIPFSELLTNSNKVIEMVMASGAHGDASHFDPQAYVDWFNAN